MGEKKTFSVRISPEIMKAARIAAVEKETTISDLIEMAIQDYLKKSGYDVKKQAKR